MKRTLFAIGGIALCATLLGWVPVSAHRESKTLVGGWFFNITPQPHPDVPTLPPPFQALVTFEPGGTLSETDTGFHPGSGVLLFPELGPLSSSDGYGVWEANGGNQYRGRLIKMLFDEAGTHVGYQISRLEFTLRGGDRLEAKADSDFVLGTDPDATPFFSGGISLIKASRLTVGD